ncbi:MAG: 4-hydroxy-3-methylbut-2-en-1-yl diphosphate synthase [Ignavibacteriales bacterium CG_4_9_14_3_um_filter_30_11]|nr:MAG: 4-hydroxy-3-methylbut-2-en-1-yl diphosphate synthase [Ignavibacteriales bacterium CG_4_9_14_3_um_filter_30_11]
MDIKNKLQFYCNNLYNYSRYKTKEVNIGDLPLGGNNPIRIQSMTTTDTMNTLATVEQSIRMIEAGCEYVRITAPSKNEAENLKNIKDELKKRGYNTPLIADIHFTPNAAIIAAKIVEKVRINPGNFVDKKKFQTIEYTDSEYLKEIDTLRLKFTPLVKVCKEYGTAMRIGTNHGSLSDRIMSRFGDTPEGMVESALEFVRICEDLNYSNIVLSMKSSNPQIMVYAYRLLVKKLEEEGMNYPLHLGVTEAGGGEDGRVKSALGIGTLLEDGLGDTIRVSLTEDPEFEIPVAQILANRYNDRSNHSKIESVLINNFDFFNYSKRETYSVENIGNGNVPIVFADYSKIKITDKEDLKQIGYVYNKLTDKWILTDNASDFIYLNDEIKNLELPLSLKKVYDFKVWSKLKDFSKSFPLLNADEYLEHNINSSIKFINVSDDQLNESLVKRLQIDTSAVLVLNTDNLNGMAEQRSTFFKLLNNNIKTPVIIKRSYKNISFDEIRLYSSTDFGSLLIDGFGDGIWLENNNYKKNSLQDINLLQFNILQAARARITKTEYIACPSCGRTLFDLQKTTEMIRKRTLHLKGVKIAIMGCIVNGPGEMADADYGYVGSGIDKITLYRGKDIVKKNIKSAIAVDELIDLIKEDDIWMEPC